MKTTKLTTIIFAFIFVLTSCKDKKTISLSPGKILNELHQSHVGEIMFMNDFIPFDKLQANDFVESLTLKEGSDLNMRMFLDKTLTYSMSQLDTSMTVNQLCENGNFQITFYVDGQKLYKNNIDPGAGSCDYKNSQTVYGVPLVRKDNIDHWGRYLWMKFFHKGGGKEALAEGKHLLKVEVRPYIENNGVQVGEIIAEGEVTFNIVNQEVDEKEIAIQEINPTDQWAISVYNFNRSAIQNVNKKIAQNQYKNITSIVVVKDGELLIEEYFNGASRETLHDTRSVGKSFASALLGIAISEGHIRDEHMTLSDFYPLEDYSNYSSEKGEITLKELLTMNSGFEGNDADINSPGNEENMYPSKDWVKFVLNLPLDPAKKESTSWQYFTGGSVLLGDIINKSVPGGLEKFAEEKLFAPLGIINYQWQYTPTEVPNTAGSLQLTALDNAKIGQLYLNNGIFEDKQIISNQWVDSSLSKHIKISERENEYYGYQFWNKTFEVSDKFHEAYYASGNGGNKIMIFKELDLVIVITATAYNEVFAHYQSEEIVVEVVDGE